MTKVFEKLPRIEFTLSMDLLRGFEATGDGGRSGSDGVSGPFR